jgi:hypothetical protein
MVTQLVPRLVVSQIFSENSLPRRPHSFSTLFPRIWVHKILILNEQILRLFYREVFGSLFSRKGFCFLVAVENKWMQQRSKKTTPKTILPIPVYILRLIAPSFITKNYFYFRNKNFPLLIRKEDFPLSFCPLIISNISFSSVYTSYLVTVHKMIALSYLRSSCV